MKRNLLITTAAATLLAGTMFAAAQGPGQIQGQGGASQGGVRVQGQGEAQGQIDQGKGNTQRSQKKEQPQTQGQGGGQGNGQGQAQGQREGGEQPKQGQRDQGKSPKQGQTQRGGAEVQQGAQTGTGASGAVTLSTEQRTKIRTTVLQSKNAPRVTNVNFSIRVGTVVPRDRVRPVAVSPVLVEIHPEWRGYVYFIVNDQIVIVEPRSYKIVAVLEV